MTLNGRTALFCTNDASFGDRHGNLKEYINGKKCSPLTLLLGGIRVHADIRDGSMARGPQTTVGLSEPAIFRYFGQSVELRYVLTSL